MDAYKILGVSRTHTIEEIKTSWKRLVKIHHTDVGGNDSIIKDINSAYDWLKKNHTQHKKSVPRSNQNTFFRVLSKSYQPVREADYLVELPFKSMKEAFTVHCISENGTEFRMNFDNGMVLPVIYKVNVAGKIMTIKFISDYFMDINPDLVKR